MSEIRIVTYRVEVACESCDWSDTTSQMNREADIGEPGTRDALQALKRYFRQEFPKCPECHAEAFEYGEPEIADILRPEPSNPPN
jgi:Zn finger protein HypA/HybF involved in hydrogenase expression